MRPFLHAAIAMVLASMAAAAYADDKPPVVGDDTDWLIARRDGQWELVSKGPTGQVRKEYLHQEVLRLGAGGVVEVVSMPSVPADEETACSQRARRNAHDPCSSSFLACRSDPGGAFTTFTMFVFDGAEGASDRRNRLICRADVDAISRAAKDVGMIRNIPPRLPESR